MYDIEEFVSACGFNKAIEVRSMISEGVNINGKDTWGYTGLMWAMIESNTEVSRILLSCNNIEIDIKNHDSGTALHHACYNNRIDSVELFLEHPTCNKEIVRIKTKGGNTAEMIADKRGNKECAKLIREYLKNNDKSEVTGT